MTIFLSTLSPNQIVWGVLIILGIILSVVVIRFLWAHILRYLLHGCVVILVIIALLALLQYLKVIHLSWPF